MKIIVIGCTHAGTAAVKKVLDLYKDAEIVIYERNDNISFLSCGIALYVQGIVKDVKGLFYSSPDELKDLGVKTCMEHDVISVDIKNKTLLVRDLKEQKDIKDRFDKLIITTGSWPINPSIEGSGLNNVMLCKNYDHAKEIIEKAPNSKNIVIVGGGYIGIELVEAFETQGKNVTLIDIEDRILKKYLDEEITLLAEKEYEGKKIKLALGQKVMEFIGDEENKVSKVITDKESYDADLVILCIGFRPNTDLFKEKLDMLPNGAIIVDRYMRTSNKDVMAAGDCCSVYYNPLEKNMYIPLATNAIRMGTLAAINLFDLKLKDIGTQGTSAIKIYNQNIASTGLTVEEAKKNFDDVFSVTLEGSFKPEFMPENKEVVLKLVYRQLNKELIGAQIISKDDYTQTINTLSVCIQNKMKLEDLAFVDQFFQPHYNKPWNMINLAALKTM